MTAWTDYVKKCAKERGIPYRQAMKECSASHQASKAPKPVKPNKTDRPKVKEPKLPMKGASKRLYKKGDDAREALLKFQEAKMKRKAKKDLIGISPEPSFGIALGY